MEQQKMFDAMMLKYKEDMAAWKNTQNNETKLLIQQNQNIMDSLKLISDNYPTNPILEQGQQQAAPQQ